MIANTFVKKFLLVLASIASTIFFSFMLFSVNNQVLLGAILIIIGFHIRNIPLGIGIINSASLLLVLSIIDIFPIHFLTSTDLTHLKYPDNLSSMMTSLYFPLIIWIILSIVMMTLYLRQRKKMI